MQIIEKQDINKTNDDHTDDRAEKVSTPPQHGHNRRKKASLYAQGELRVDKAGV